MARKRTKAKTETDVEELAKQVSYLSEQDRAEFFRRVGGIDLIKYLPAEIRIDDWQGMDRKWPRATIRYYDESEESIDIINTVKENTVSIGHPLVLHAIRRWEHIVLYHHAFSGGGQYKTSRINFYIVAKTHLENLGKALLEGIRNRAIPREYALYIRRALGTDMDYVYLEMAWEMLAEDDVKYKRLGEGVKNERTASDKRRLIAKKLKASIANWVHLQSSPVMRLQSSVARQQLLGGRLKYADPSPQLKLKDPAGNLMDVSPDSSISYSPDSSQFELWLKPPDGPLLWVKLSELMQRIGSNFKANESVKFGVL